ncbi:hypothetical protein HYDPIDRAFT_188240 [Hydnomerulius pinastri MD-312]|uniref:NF-X1-type domain-containing protein n=1 Tax=Hydnomerulius pinastri MD-312 TaxID=994086 RepID=A0A0C9VE31_9AGAM|nr:hypothetical protein HYDPIDRAFT_188240 [Hydnomerulius pinastri MD-312]
MDQDQAASSQEQPQQQSAGSTAQTNRNRNRTRRSRPRERIGEHGVPNAGSGPEVAPAPGASNDSRDPATSQRRPPRNQGRTAGDRAPGSASPAQGDVPTRLENQRRRQPASRSGQGEEDSRQPRRPPRANQPPPVDTSTSNDAQPQAQRPSRRAKFNAALTESSDAQASSSQTPKEPPARQSKPKRPRVPPGDDLTSTLTHALRTPPFPDCPICFNPIRPEQPTWSCSPSSKVHVEESTEDKDKGHCCWTTFHLKCIRSWADKSVKDLVEAWRARGEVRPGEWRCPGCQAKREEVPHVYSCFCHRMPNPSPPRLATPHSCAQSCSRPRSSGCDHACPLPCHPGPCPPCAVTVRRACFCGKEVRSTRCQVGVSTLAAGSFPCMRPCDRPLSCGNPTHKCTTPCHSGPCSPCQATEEVRCWCGRETKVIACGELNIEDGVKCAILKKNQGFSEEEEEWVGRFGCANICERPFSCTHHACSKPCHPPSRTPPPCPFDPERVTSCACGRCRVARSSDEPAMGGSSIDISSPILPARTSCTSPLPTCSSPCSKSLPCGHSCKTTCHWGSCPPCTEQVERTCRCGGTKRQVRCGDVTLSDPTSPATEAQEIICDRPCPALRACGRHQCGRICCPLASLSSTSRTKSKKQRPNPTSDPHLLEELGTEEGGLHECDLPCNRVMGCGNHRCPKRDHKGNCGVCLRSIFEELLCPCGRTVLEPPIPCGTRLNCTYPCARPPPPCGHPRVPHGCHEGVVIASADTADEGLGVGAGDAAGTGACPPCPFLTRKECACGKKMVDNVKCSQERVSCGSVCKKLLACGFHHCERPCHADECGACTAVCGKSRKSCLPAHHPCTQTCHAPASCPETEPCLALVTLTCPCGHLRSTVPCSGNKLPLKCNGECGIKKRNARLAEALGISAEKRDGAAGTRVTWSDDLVAVGKGAGGAKFLALVEKAFADFITSERRIQVLPHMPPERRKFVNDLASIYRMDTTMVDQEPHRSVQLIRRIDTRIPTPLLSQHIASTAPSLGKLADLRAPRATAAAGAGGGKWTAIVGKPASTPASGSGSGHASPWGGTSPARVPSPALGSGARASASVSRAQPGPSRSPAPAASSGSATTTSTSTKPTSGTGAWVSPSVQAQRAKEAAEAKEDVPDDWEDDI